MSENNQEQAAIQVRFDDKDGVIKVLNGDDQPLARLGAEDCWRLTDEIANALLQSRKARRQTQE